MKEKKTITKKIKALLLAVAMIVTSFPAFSTTVHAAELPDSTQFATVDELITFDTDDTNEENSAKVYFGNNNQQWWIAGSQNSDSIVLFAESPLETSQQFEPSWDSDKTYDEGWGCIYLDGSPINVWSSHYGASPLRNTLRKLETTYFSSSEQDLMNTTTIYTDDGKNNKVYSITEKMYLAYGNINDTYITVGTNRVDSLNNGLRVNQDYWGNIGNSFWLRALNTGYTGVVLMADKTSSVRDEYVFNTGALVPAFELDISTVLFGSTVPAISSNGQQSTNDAFTLRYASDDLGSAQVSYDKSKVNLSSVPSDTYLVAQNSEGAYAKKITNETSVSASDMKLSSFDNCKVWLETTESDKRMTYATLATQANGYSVNINIDSTMAVSSGDLVQTDVTGNIDDIVINTGNDYFFPADYTVAEQDGITVTRDSENQITISGTPTADVNITLPPATKKVYSMTLDGNGTFTGTCVGYEPIIANEFIITNNGNVDLENVNVSITGNDADKFELDWNKTTAIQPNGTITVTVKPNDSLDIRAYQATLSVSADNVNTVTTDLQFTVSEHDYNAVVTPPTCTEKGYTTYTCKNCSHSYKDDEVNANGHTWGEWEIIDAPTCEQGGIRKRTCEVCGASETENLNPNGHDWETAYTVDKEPTCTQDGSKSIHCKNCVATKDSEPISRLEHSFINYVSDNNATCTKDGTKTAKCERCDETDTIADTGSMLEHEYEWKYNNDATCTENGTETGTCKHCQAEMTREKADSALGHEFKNYVSDDNATCTENGTETSKCERCDKIDTRTEENSVLGHKLTEWEIIKKATTTTTGMKERTCERCDYKETEVLPMISDDNNTPNQEKPNTDKDNVKTGDQTNVGLFTSMFTMSGLLIAILVVFKKKKALEHR